MNDREARAFPNPDVKCCSLVIDLIVPLLSFFLPQARRAGAMEACRIRRQHATSSCFVPELPKQQV